jgi:hypothetical protein
MVKPEKVEEVLNPSNSTPLKPIKPVPKPTVRKSHTVEFDIDKFAHAVARHETGDCKKGNSAQRNNCFGIMTWKNGKRSFRTFKTKEESYVEFKRIWSTHY